MNKQALWLRRIDQALNEIERQIAYRLMAEETDSQEYEHALERARQHHVIDCEYHQRSMPFLDARALCDELRSCLAQAAEQSRGFTRVELAALESLGELLGVRAQAEHVATLQTRFESSNLTYQGDFERFKKGLRFGLNVRDDFSVQPRLDLSKLEVPEKEFDKYELEGSELATAKVRGTMRFQVRFFSDEDSLSLEDLSARLRVLVGHEFQPVPTQYLVLRDVQVLEHTMG